MKRLNITVPEELSKELENIPNKSKFISEVLQKELKELKLKRLDSLLIEGYKKTNDEDHLTDTEWEDITLESWP
jgi:metal-responsive CopG/Arc/MetJ family transcriptional regulator